MAHLIAIAASQAGPAHAFMLGEALQAAATRLGHRLTLKVVSRLGTEGGYTADEARQAEAVIVAADMAVDRSDLPPVRVVETTPDAVFRDAGDVVRQALASLGMPAAPPAPVSAAAGAAGTEALRIVAITACPTGVAHTFMAAEALEQGAKALGHTIRVETQGSVGAQNTLTPAEIAAADLVILAADTQVDKARFAGKRLYSAGTKAAIRDAGALIAQARAAAVPWGAPPAGGASTAAAGSAPAATTRAPTAGPYKHLMTGVSFMLPFVVAGGLLIALAFALGGIYVYDDAHKGTLGWTLFQVGAKGGFALMVPALAGYIAFSIADRPGLAPGMIGGLLANTVGAGFLGGIVAGFIAGYGVA